MKGEKEKEKEKSKRQRRRRKGREGKESRYIVGSDFIQRST